MEPLLAVGKEPGAGKIPESPAWQCLRQNTPLAVSIDNKITKILGPSELIAMEKLKPNSQPKA